MINCAFTLAQSENLIVTEDSLISKLMSVKKEIDRDSYESQFFTIQLYYGELYRSRESF